MFYKLQYNSDPASDPALDLDPHHHKTVGSDPPYCQKRFRQDPWNKIRKAFYFGIEFFQLFFVWNCTVRLSNFLFCFYFKHTDFLKMKPTALLDQIIILLESNAWNISAIKVQNQSILTLFSTRTCSNWARCSVFSRVCSSKQDGEHYEGDSSGLCWPLYGLPPGHRTKKRDQQVYESTSVGTFIPR